MFRKLKYTFIGRPLKSLTDGEGGLLGKMQALAMLSSDALSSIAYGPEQVILVLVSLSPLAIWWSLPIGIFVLLLLASLTIYGFIAFVEQLQQTVFAFHSLKRHN